MKETAPLQEPAQPSASSPLRPTLVWLGRFHLLLLHFPIALLMAAMAREGWLVWKGSRIPSPEVRFCLALAAASAVPTVVLGWFFAMSGHASSSLLPLHRWLGTMAAGWAVAAAISSELDVRRGARSWRTRGLLFAAVLLVGVAAHLGGLMVHGTDFFDW